jgi:hypothetical protein
VIPPARLVWIIIPLLVCGCRNGADEQARTATAAQPAPGAAPVDTAGQRRARRLAEVRGRQRSMPRFEDHPAGERFTGTPAPVDLSSAEGARRFRTVLRDGAAKGPNFAGHYTFVQWGCGSSCQSFAIVDARTGRVTFGNQSLSVGADYRLDSRLLVANPPERWLESYGADATDAVGGNASSTYYRWDGSRLVPLDSLPVGSGLHW